MSELHQAQPAYPYETRLNILHAPLELIDVGALAAACTHKWYNQTLCRVNDSVVRLGVVEGEYHWHQHDELDEFFYVVSDMAARLRATHPELFVGPGVPSAGSAASEPPAAAREQPPGEPGLSSVLQRMGREQVARREEERRAADPFERERARLSELAPRLTSDEVSMVEDALRIAKDEIAAGREKLGQSYLGEVRDYLTQVENPF